MPRREFLRAGALALGGLQLGELLGARALAAAPPRTTAVILFWMWGGPSQFETWDPKPDAPREYRGPFTSIETTVPGMRICEVFPRQAQIAHRVSLIRSLHHEMSAHNDGSIEVLTGKTPAKPDPTSTAFSEHPDFGMIASRLRTSAPRGLPAYVGIPRQPFMTRPTYLGAAHSAVATGDPSAKDFRPPNLSLAAGLDGARLADRRHLQAQFDRMRRDLDRRGALAGVDEFDARAFEMLLNPRVAEAFDLSREEDALRDRYGRHLWGQACLLARRLATSGVSVITIDALAPTLSDRYFSWDDHINPMTRWDLADAMRYRAPFMDQALAALIDDLHERGLSDDVLVVALGEFGRTPRIVESAGLIGRDHWPQA
ncbi:MAG: DUF1501 domain-containing protein, partial [Planctomycetaceae bacterium]|nr:DUF1501 domain-containing protein [Planctomycetaceae bacterium]